MTTPHLYYTFTSDALTASNLLEVMHFTGHESLSKPYEFIIDLKSEHADIDVDSLLERPAHFGIHLDADTRVVHGILRDVEQLNPIDKYSIYRVVLVPRLWQLSLHQTNEVYLGKTVPQILEMVLQEAGFTTLDYELKLLRNYRAWPYRCQYGESHFDFISRLMEREGIFYYFEQKDDLEKLVITDHLQFYGELADPNVSYLPATGLDIHQLKHSVQSFVCKTKRIPHNLVLKDYNDQTPAVDIRGEAEVDPQGVGEVYVYGEHLESQDEGAELATIRAEEIRAGKKIYHGESTVPRLCSGYTTLMKQHYRADFNQRYLITAIDHEGYQPGHLSAAGTQSAGQVPTYLNNFSAIPADVQYRPERNTQRPRFHGTINAMVDAEGDGQYAEIDEQGRYRVILPFDRVLRQEGKASHWVAMAQPFAGEAEGMHFPLRKSAKVLLTFIDGDPDRPVIASAVPNAAQPSVVTSEHQTRNVIKTSGGNFIEMEDREDCKRIKLYSPRNETYMHLGAPNHAGDGFVSLTLGLDRKEILGGQHTTLMTKSAYQALSSANKSGNSQNHLGNDSTRDYDFVNEQSLIEFKAKDRNGKDTGATLSREDELSGNYHIWRRSGTQYQWEEGNIYRYGNTTEFDFGNAYAESHANEEGINGDEVWPSASSPQGVGSVQINGSAPSNTDARWNPGGGFIEKTWANIFAYQKGRNYTWQSDLREYTFGRGYSELHTASSTPNIDATWVHDSLVGTIGMSSFDAAADIKRRVDNVAPLSLSADDTHVEKIIGNTYSYQKGNVREVMVGNTEEEVYGTTRTYFEGTVDEVFKGGATRYFYGASEEKFCASAHSVYVGAKNEVQMAAVNEMTLGISNEMKLAVANELFIGAKVETLLAAKLEINMGAKFECDVAVKTELNSGKIHTAATKIQSAAAYIGSGAVSLTSTAGAKLSNAGVAIKNAVLTLIN
jgi:type VI secretion system secreted protein VgrG